MNKIITISREFGSGGREIGKRLAEALGIAYYDREILSALSEKSGLVEEYIESVTEKGVQGYYPISYGRTFSFNPLFMKEQTGMLLEQRKIIRSLAEKSDCVIVGRGAQSILEDFRPYSIFVYANMESKLSRCMEREKDGTSEAEMKKKIAQIDKNRAKSWEVLSDVKWGDKRGYHLCVNTSDMEIKSLIQPLVQLQENYFSGEGFL